MAEKQVVRKDVISISFEVDNAAVKQTQDMVSNIVGDAGRATQEMADSVNASMGSAADSVSGAADAIADMKNPITDAAESLGDAGNEVTAFAENLQSAVNSGIDEIAQPVQATTTALGSAKEEAGDFVTKLKDIGDQKLTTISSSANELKSELTEGKTDAADLASEIKNVNKTSVTSVTSNIKKISTNAKSAKSELDDMDDTDMSGLTKSLDGVDSKLSDIASKAAGAAKTALKGLGVAFGAAVAGVTATVKSAVSEHADYEQLTGGIETLFKDSADAVMAYADDAYMTAGLSANEYMETVTSFSASLISSLGGDTAAAADKANQALVDMSDNANKMGTDMESIQNAYQGFAKQNYTMLDNLKLGYGGTKEEMERLLKDAQAISGVKYDIDSYADVVDAIHVIQESMDITGTTAEEASTTISGSLSMVKSSWKNVLTAMVTGGDTLDDKINDFVESAKTFGTNIMPAIESALKDAGQMIESLAPVIADELPNLVNDLLPSLISAALSLVQGLIKALPGIIQTLIAQLPNIISQIGSAIMEAFGADCPIISQFASMFTENADTIAKAIPYVIGFIGALTSISKISSVAKSASGALSSASGGTSGITSFFEGFAKTKTSTILKGVANMLIVFAAITAMAAGIMLIAPYLAELSDAKSLIEVLAVITVVGLLSVGFAELAGIVGKMPVSTVAKGLANMAIVFAGITALAALLILITPLLADMMDVSEILSLLVIITAVGLVGAALAVLAGIVGMIPIAVVLNGLAGIALAIAGFAAIVAAFAALASIPGYTEFMDKGGAALSQLAEILGDVIGSFVGGVFEGIASVLPAIGESLAGFAEAAQPFFDLAAGAEVGGMGDFLLKFAEFALMMTANDLLSFFTGGMDLTTLGTDLSMFIDSAQPFFETVMTIPQESFDSAAALFECLGDIGNVPNTGGIAQWFSGTNDYEGLAEGLGYLSSEKAVTFFETVMTIPQEAFDNAAALFECLGDIGNVPNTGGVAQWFSGTNNYEDLAEGLGFLGGENVSSFFSLVSTYRERAFTNAARFFECLGDIGNVPNTGGIGQWFGGTNDYASLSSGLGDLSNENVSGFFDLMGSLPTTAFKNASSLFELFGEMGNMKTGGVKSWFDSGVNFANIGTGLARLAGWNATTFYTKMGEVKSATFDNMEALFKVFDKLTDYTTDGAVKWFDGTVKYDAINSALGKMISAVPFFVLAAKIPAQGFTNTELLFRCLDAMSEYSGTGFLKSDGMFDVVSAGLTATAAAVAAFASEESTAGVNGLVKMVAAFAELGDNVAMANEAVSEEMTSMSDAVKKQCSVIKTQVTQTAKKIKSEFSSVNLKSVGADIMTGLLNGLKSKETTLMTYVKNLAKNIPTTVTSLLDVNSPSRVMYEIGGFTAQGLINGISDSIPRAEDTSERLAAAVTYGDTENVYTGGNTHTENNNYSPVFNLTISGTSSDRDTERKVKKWIKECLNDIDASTERKSPIVQAL